jgi:hypothetical protein
MFEHAVLECFSSVSALKICDKAWKLSEQFTCGSRFERGTSKMRRSATCCTTSLGNASWRLCVGLSVSWRRCVGVSATMNRQIQLLHMSSHSYIERQIGCTVLAMVPVL